MIAYDNKIPPFSEHEVVTFSKQIFNINTSAEKLPGERDKNFLLKDNSNNCYILKIANAEEKRSVLDFQNCAMEHIHKKSKENLCPKVYPTKQGEKIGIVYDENKHPYFIRLLSFIPGTPFAKVNPHSPVLLYKLGEFMAKIVKTLSDFSHPESERKIIWDMKYGLEAVKQHQKYIKNSKNQQMVKKFLSLYKRNTDPLLSILKRSVIHHDGNDYNILVSFPDKGQESFGNRDINGIVDFGDMVKTYTICELAIVCTYAMLEKENPLMIASQIIAGYNSLLPLTENELRVLFPMICMRLCISVSISSFNAEKNPDNEYLQISSYPAWNLMEKLDKVHPHLALYKFRNACGKPPCPDTKKIITWLKDNKGTIRSIAKPAIDRENSHVFDLSIGSTIIENPNKISDVSKFSDYLFKLLEKRHCKYGLGKYNEVRLCYSSPIFKSENQLEEGRTLHIGLDIFAPPGTAIFSPLEGVVHSFRFNHNSLDYGPTIILQHKPEDDIIFYSLYGHLSENSLHGLYKGKKIKAGEKFAFIGEMRINGGWPPHLHFQIITDIFDYKGDFPGVAKYSEKDIWLSICPDPGLMVEIPEYKSDSLINTENIVQLRETYLGPSLSLSYKKPLTIVRGFMQHLYDDKGRIYLDVRNNVPHVGHSNPKVVEAGQKQMAVLNTNTRYLHKNIVEYCQRLCSTMPDPLRVCYLVNSGSEANDLALRMAYAHTNKKDIIVLDGAYHGNLSSLIEISPYKFDGPGGRGESMHTKKVIMPDLYQGPYRYDDPAAGKKYAEHIRKAISEIQNQNRDIAAFICEPLMGCGGQIVMPDDFLKFTYKYVREAGGVCIADEVQIGFGRVGPQFWGFKTQKVVPDIITLGKPIGNGHPLAAVITSPEIARSFDNGMEYFNTYGGNPVSCAIGMAVLKVIEEEKLAENALQVGDTLKKGLCELQTKYPLIGDVRGLGLFLGVELVLDRETRKQAPFQAAYIVERMKDNGILIGSDGLHNNVLKIKPPIIFNQSDADMFLEILDKILNEDLVRIE